MIICLLSRTLTSITKPQEMLKAGVVFMECTFIERTGGFRVTFIIVMNEKYKDDYNIHLKICMNTSCTLMSVLHMYTNMDESI